MSESMLQVEANSYEAEDDLKVRQPFRVFVEPPEQALDATINEGCTCEINAAVGREWARAMRVGDCVTLLRALKTNPCLLATNFSQSDWEGVYHSSGGKYTVLHWAAKRRCLKLLVYILSLFLDDSGKVVKEFVHGVTKIDRKKYFEKRNDNELTAADLLWSVRDYSIYAYFANFAKYRECNLTLKEMQLELLDPMYVSPDLASSPTSLSISISMTPSPSSSPTWGALPNEKVNLREIVMKASKKYEMLLKDRLASDYDYNFVVEYDELLFHFACGHMNIEECAEYERSVTEEVAKEGRAAVSYLFNYRNAQGQAPLHCAYNDLQNRRSFLLKVEVDDFGGQGDHYNSCDVGGWTILHVAASQGDEDVVKALLRVQEVDVNAKVLNKDRMGATALHLAIVHDRLGSIRLLIQHGRADVNALLRGYFSYNGIEKFELHTCTPLHLAATMGRSAIVKALINRWEVEDLVYKRCGEISAIHIAAIKGDPKMLRYLINNPKFDISITFKGCTALHFVVDGSHLGGDVRRKSMKKYCHDESAFRRFKKTLYITDTDRMACISMLIQAGLDVWQKSDEGNFPEPGRNASSEVRHFWYQKLMSVTQEAKNNLNVAGNAISVVSALVATASYVGPLQPPLGLDGNSVHDGSLPIRVYMVTNSLSFYMAVASIIFAVVPSLPMPQEALYEEWQRSQKTIIVAIHLLLLAVMSILISFGAASNAIMSSEYSWQHQGLVFYPTILGGLICVIAIGLFYLCLLRLTLPKNVTIKYVYQHAFRAVRKEKVKNVCKGDGTFAYASDLDDPTDSDDSIHDDDSTDDDATNCAGASTW